MPYQFYLELFLFRRSIFHLQPCLLTQQFALPGPANLHNFKKMQSFGVAGKVQTLEYLLTFAATGPGRAGAPPDKQCSSDGIGSGGLHGRRLP